MSADIYWINGTPCGRLAIVGPRRTGDWKASGLTDIVSFLAAFEIRETGLTQEAQWAAQARLGFESCPIPDVGYYWPDRRQWRSEVRKALLLCPLMCGLVAAQTTIPDTPLGHTLTDYLSAFNSGDMTKIDAFDTAHHFGVPAEDQIRFFRQSGGFVLKKVESSETASMSALVQEGSSDAILRMTLKETGSAGAPKLEIKVEEIARPTEFAIPRLSERDALKALDVRATQLATQGRLAGAMLVARRGKIIYGHAWGMADRAAGIPNTLDTKFRLGSDNKMFTAVAVLQLVGAGKVSLDAKVGDYLPNYPNENVARKVSVRMLLNHSGGTGDFFGPDFEKNRLSLKHNEDYVRTFGTNPLAFEPGSSEAYSNFGYIILGSIVQHVSGEDYYDYVRRHVFLPAGMRNTDSAPESDVVVGRAVAYTFADGEWIDASNTLPPRGMAAGGGYSTVRDLLKFARALQTGKLLPPSLVSQATHFQTRGKWYGFGFAINGESGLEHWYGHGGGAPGMSADLRVFPESDTVIVTLANVDPPVANRLTEFYLYRMPLN